MKWFEGTIHDAVVLAKQRQVVFVVVSLAHDDNAESQKLQEALEIPQVEELFSSENFITIQLRTNTAEYRQFAEIYKMIPVPSVYFISDSGVPLEIAAGSFDSSEIMKRANGALQQQKQIVSGRNATVPPPTPSSQPDASPSQSSSETTNAQQEIQEPRNDPSPDSLEDRVERVRLLAAQKREEREAEESETARQKEIQRRHEGQEWQKMQRQLQLEQEQRERSQRQKEKREETEARERVRRQIEQDRLDRSKRYAREAQQQAEQAGAPQAFAPVRSNSNVARLQFRLPNGSHETHEFPAEATLHEVRDWLRANVAASFRNVSLSVPFPRRDFQEEDMTRTLRDLLLVPSAALLVLPVSRIPSSSPVPTSLFSSLFGSITGFVWMLISPFLSLGAAVRNALFGPPADGRRDRTEPQGGSASAGNPDPSGARPRTARFRGQPPTYGRTHRESNIHRLTNRDDSDSENNTWNGNSTQQM